MSLLFLIITGTVIALILYLSIREVKKKRIQMYKQQYEKALQSGNSAIIIDLGRVYYAAIQPHLQEIEVDTNIQHDILKVENGSGQHRFNL